MRDIAYSLFGILGKCLTPGGIYRLGGWLGALLWMCLPGRRRLAVETIAERLGVDRSEARRVARESFGHTCRSFLEIFLRTRLDHRFVEARVDIVDPEHLEGIRNDPQAKVVVTAHLGAWELGMPLARLAMPGIECGAVARTVKDPALNDLVLHLRRRPGIQIIENRQGSLRALRILRKKGIVVFVVDHNCMRDMALFLPFLGKTAAVYRGPAQLAARSGATIWPVFCTRRPGGRYELHIGKNLDTKSLEGTDEEKIEAVARFYTKAVEDMVRRYPEQWLWMHKRWKTRPPEETGEA